MIINIFVDCRSTPINIHNSTAIVDRKAMDFIMKKRFILFSIVAALTASMLPTVHADNENWRDAFVTRAMKLMSTDPQYNEMAITDLDENGVPEVFLYKNSNDGGIGYAFTMSQNQIAAITVPGNIIGACMSDIEVYQKEDRRIFVGKEIPRYSSVIRYYKLTLSGNILSAEKIQKSDVSPYQAIQYVDIHSSNLLTNGYPNRNKIKDFINNYQVVNTLSATKSTANLSVNGREYDILGYTVNNSNYYKLRDIAMLLRTSSSRFNVEWDGINNAIKILPGVKYQPVGGELTDDTSTTLSISPNKTPIYVDTLESDVTTYTINGSTYIQIRDLADIAGFNVDWNNATQTVIVTTN